MKVIRRTGKTGLPQQINSIARAAIDANERQKQRMTEMIEREMGRLRGKIFCVLGLAFKNNTDDLRESPTLKIMQLLIQRGAHVDYNDPYFPALHKMRHYDYSEKKSVALTPQALAGYDCVVIATDHSSYDYAAIVAAAQLVVDTRNATRPVKEHREKIVLC